VYPWDIRYESAAVGGIVATERGESKIAVIGLYAQSRSCQYGAWTTQNVRR
jgi:hypothetical protein